jgi:PleD family two-component response regulator
MENGSYMVEPDRQSRILIVDDSNQNVMLLGTILKKRNYLIHVAKNGVQALKIIEHEPPDLILLDILLPEMNGFEVCETLKANPRTREIPVIFLTGKTDKDDIIRGFDLGAVDFITKPFNKRELVARVAAHLRLRRLEQAVTDARRTVFTSIETLTTLIDDGILPQGAQEGIQTEKNRLQTLAERLSAAAEGSRISPPAGEDPQ